MFIVNCSTLNFILLFIQNFTVCIGDWHGVIHETTWSMGLFKRYFEPCHQICVSFRYKEPSSFKVERWLSYNGLYYTSPSVTMYKINNAIGYAAWEWMTMPYGHDVVRDRDGDGDDAARRVRPRPAQELMIDNFVADDPADGLGESNADY